jgi:1-acyl-sn-glycerol-3-phosphate acyltransferase
VGAALRRLRSLLAFLGLLVWFLLGAIYQRLLVWPVVSLRPSRRAAVVSAYMKGMTAGIFALLRLGGARIDHPGRLPTETPILVLMNHQSLLDILIINAAGDPFVPWFITRGYYGRFIPVISLCIRLQGCPLIDPRDLRGSLRKLRQAAGEQEHGIVIFPEGHRSAGGQMSPFKTGGVEIMLRERRTPVYLVVGDGLWRTRAFRDFVFNIHAIRGRSEVLGPFEAPVDPHQLGSFVDTMREKMVAHLERMRANERT